MSLHFLLRFAIILVIILQFQTDSNAASGIGKIILLTGDVDITETESNIKIVPGVGTTITANERIRTGVKAYVEILLNDNTKIFMRELTIIQITSLRMKIEDSPTRIIFSTGKIRVNVNRLFRSRNLIVRTNAAVIGVKSIETDMGIITTATQTKLAVFEGEADIASSDKDIIKSYDLAKKEESTVFQGKSPSEPVILPQEILDSWLDYYEVVDKDRIAVKGKQEKGIIDFILKKRKF